MEKIDSIEALQNIQVTHYKEHQENKSIYTERDYSCQLCYSPPARVSTNFEKFMTQCKTQFNVETYSWKTVEAF